MIRSASSLLSVILASAAAMAQGEVDSRSAVKKGGDVWLVHQSSLASSHTGRGQTFKILERVGYTLRLRVTDIDVEGNYLVEATVARVQGRIERPWGQGEFDFDSAATAEEPAGAGQGSPQEMRTKQALYYAAGKSFSCKVTPTGRFVAFTSDVKSVLGEGLRADVMHQLGAPALRQLVERSFGDLPPKRTAGGARWKRDATSWYGRMATQQKLELSLTVVDPEFFEIEGAGTVDIDREGAKQAEGFSGEEAKQLDNTTVKNSKLTSKQRTSRHDGFVSEATSEVAMDWEMSDPRMGDGTVAFKITTATARTTAEAALSKPAAKKAGESR
jgi:hypothetical protein